MASKTKSAAKTEAKKLPTKAIPKASIAKAQVTPKAAKKTAQAAVGKAAKAKSMVAPKPAVAATKAAAPARPASKQTVKQEQGQRKSADLRKPPATEARAPIVSTQPVNRVAAKAGEAPAVATPKELAQKTASAAQSVAARKPVQMRHGFKTLESIVYPAHGVGRIVAIEEQEIAGMSLELFVIQFDKDKLTLRVPTNKALTGAIRKLADEAVVRRAMETLKGKARIKRTMWSRRAQEFDQKINSGDLVAISEVVRDLFRAETQPEQSYSERQLYEAALDRMAREIAVIESLDERSAVQRITDVLLKSARGRRTEGVAVPAEEPVGDEIKAA